MSLADRLSADITASLKGGRKLRLETLRTVLAALKEKMVEKRPAGGITPDDELAVLMQAAKKRREAADIFLEKGRKDLADAEEAELAVIREYLPAQMTPEELTAIVMKTIAAVGAAGPKDFGKVMPAVMREVKGRIDGKVVQTAVKSNLEELSHGDA